MKRFKFRLEKVLQYREALKTEKKRVLTEKIAILRDGEKKLEELYSAQAANAAPDGVVEAGMFFLAGQYASRLKEEIEKQKAFNAKAEEDVAEARQEYIEASKEVKTLEMLKAKKLEAYNEEVKQEENKFLDEITTQRARY